MLFINNGSVLSFSLSDKGALRIVNRGAADVQNIQATVTLEDIGGSKLPPGIVDLQTPDPSIGTVTSVDAQEWTWQIPQLNAGQTAELFGEVLVQDAVQAAGLWRIHIVKTSPADEHPENDENYRSFNVLNCDAIGACGPITGGDNGVFTLANNNKDLAVTDVGAPNGLNFNFGASNNGLNLNGDTPSLILTGTSTAQVQSKVGQSTATLNSDTSKPALVLSNGTNDISFSIDGGKPVFRPTIADTLIEFQSLAGVPFVRLNTSTGQVSFPLHTDPSKFPGTPAVIFGADDKGNLLTLDPSILPQSPGDVIVSQDANNGITVGSDGGAYLSTDPFILCDLTFELDIPAPVPSGRDPAFRGEYKFTSLTGRQYVFQWCREDITGRVVSPLDFYNGEDLEFFKNGVFAGSLNIQGVGTTPGNPDVMTTLAEASLGFDPTTLTGPVTMKHCTEFDIRKLTPPHRPVLLDVQQVLDSGSAVPSLTGVEKGDLILAVVNLFFDPDREFTLPEGWIRITDCFEQGVGHSMEIFAKTATDAEPATYDFQPSSTATVAWAVLAYWGSNLIVESSACGDIDVDFTTATEVNSAGGMSSSNNSIVLRFYTSSDATVDPPPGTTPATGRKGPCCQIFQDDITLTGVIPPKAASINFNFGKGSAATVIIKPNP